MVFNCKYKQKTHRFFVFFNGFTVNTKGAGSEHGRIMLAAPPNALFRPGQPKTTKPKPKIESGLVPGD